MRALLKLLAIDSVEVGLLLLAKLALRSQVEWARMRKGCDGQECACVRVQV
jgi:hypothetical protein